MQENNKPETDSTTYKTDMCHLYQFTESEFLEFDKIVPMRLNTNMMVVSPKLYFLLMTICGQIESLVACICKDLDMYKNGEKFAACYKKLLEKSNVIENQSVQIVTTRNIIKPFAKTKNDTPSWWTSYNKVKHTIPKGIEYATMENTLHALGGLYLLLILHRLVPDKTPNDILDKQYWAHDSTMPFLLSDYLPRFNYIQDKDYISNLFFLKSYFVPSG